ncbi:Na(+)/dicarboxylate cotransporter 3-like [Heterodontus francisci]|uniref:Na(+)/dicarboxylate cotransporter 3-like n=1 Tax=Heterodontus francisci TaxID=7792 RepID=UPI00355B37D8
MGAIFRRIWKVRQQLILILAPLVFLPALFLMPHKEGSCLYIILIMATFWCTEALPLAVTSLLPICLFPFFGVLPSSKTCPLYFLDTNILFFGGLMIAVAIEDCKLHRRVALRILMCLGVNPFMLILGMMLTTALLSMWLSNTATTAMMMPVATAILKSLYSDLGVVEQNGMTVNTEEPQENESAARGSKEYQETPNERKNVLQELEIDGPQLPIGKNYENNQHKDIAKGILISIPYAATIGGVTTLTGTPPNLILDGQLKSIFPQSDELNFGSWFLFASPLTLLFLIFGWLWLSFMYGGLNLRSLIKKKNTEAEARAKAVLQTEYAKLGSISFAEGAMATFFILFVLLLFTRDPKFMTGWEKIFQPKYVTDAVVAMTVVIILFIFPSRKPSFKWNTNPKEPITPNQPLLTWKKVQDNVAWNVILLVGGGFAIAKGCEESGLSRWIGNRLHPLEHISPSIAVLLICLVIASFTEFASNTATSVIFLPVLAELAVRVRVHPLYLMIPGAVSCSFAFMLPVATPPNAIAFTTGQLKVKDMIKAGMLMNILGIIFVNLSLNTWGSLIFKLSTFPKWAEPFMNDTRAATNVKQQFLNTTY